MIALILLALDSAPLTPLVPQNRESWIATGDYPPKALRSGEEGMVEIKLEVSSNGVPVKCNVIQSSGYEDIDTTTCQLLMSRGRFNATTGNQASRFYQTRIAWRIPSEKPQRSLEDSARCAARDLLRMFPSIDANKDKSIDRKEFFAFFQGMNPSGSLQQRQTALPIFSALFDSQDLNKDGKVSLTELNDNASKCVDAAAR